MSVGESGRPPSWLLTCPARAAAGVRAGRGGRNNKGGCWPFLGPYINSCGVTARAAGGRLLPRTRGGVRRRGRRAVVRPAGLGRRRRHSQRRGGHDTRDGRRTHTHTHTLTRARARADAHGAADKGAPLKHALSCMRVVISCTYRMHPYSTEPVHRGEDGAGFILYVYIRRLDRGEYGAGFRLHVKI